MTLSDILSGLPGTIVSRFSASNNAFWIAKCSDILSDLDNECPGPWMIEDVKCLPMASGFFRTPPSMTKIKDVKVVDSFGRIVSEGACSIKRINSLGFDLVDKFSAMVSTSQFSVSSSGITEEKIQLGVVGTSGIVGDILEGQDNLLWVWVDENVSPLTSDPFGGKYLTIYRKDGSNSCFQINMSSYVPSLDNPENGKQCWYLTFAQGTALLATVGDNVVITDSIPSESVVPGSYAVISGQDYSELEITETSQFPGIFDRHKPGRIFSTTPSTLFTSNVIASGYVKTPKPSSLSDNLLIPPEWDHLMQAGLRWKAELDMSPASNDAIMCGKLYSAAQKEYRTKLSMGQGNVHKNFFQGPNLRMGDLYNA